MLKNILNLEGVSTLGRDEQKKINGGLLNPTCIPTGQERILTSPEGQPVAINCQWNCGGQLIWGGCGI
ncbi:MULTISPECIES: hypothetical protein [Flavobacterium]|uniref:Natural product n=1 Tax=Flavobacterium hankyongi TaxID=1176532 RepID=A0ABP8ZKW1_9FLAO|nr:hypothetical protein [Flavobacterium sp. N1846]